MTSRCQRSIPPNRPGSGIAACLAAAAVLLFLGCMASAQEPQAPPPGAPPAAESPRRSAPGLLEAIGRWFDESAARFHTNMRAARGTLDNLGDKATGAAKDAADVAKDAAKDAADTVARLPSARIVAGRERCVPAPNGAPDCKVAADAVCRGKGFASGKSVDIQSSQKCPVRVWLSGRKPNADECETESFVIKAVCQ